MNAALGARTSVRTQTASLSRLRSSSLLLLACSVGAAQVDSWTMWQDPASRFGWNTRLAAGKDPSIFTGFSRHIMPARAGWWGDGRVIARVATLAQPYTQPGEGPAPESGAITVGVGVNGSSGAFFLRLDPEVVVGMNAKGQDTVPNPYLNDVWNGVAPDHVLSKAEVAPRGSVGVVGLGHALVASTEPFQWGEGIFGGIVVGRSWKGFPHLAVMPEHSWDLGAPLEIPATLRYELVMGAIPGDRPEGTVDQPLWYGIRAALRWGWTTISGTLGAMGGGKGQDAPSFNDLTNPDTNETTDTLDVNRIISIGLAQWLGSRFVIGVEYGIDDWNPYYAKGKVGDFGRLNGFHPLTAAWTTTLDWVDVTGSGDWRLALEWYRSEAYFYSHGKYGPYAVDGFPLAHADGGNANSVRFLVQTVTSGGSDVDVIGTWRSIGWRNQTDDNINPRLGRGQAAPAAWEHVGIDLRTRSPLPGDWGSLLTQTGLGVDRHYMNDVRTPEQTTAPMAASIAVGWEQSW